MTFSLALALIYSVGWIPCFVFRTESPAGAWSLLTTDERLWTILTPAIITVHLTLSCLTISVAPAIAPWRAGTGLTLFAAGMAFWFWARVMIGPLRRRRLPDEPPPHFRRDGAFGLVRNPLYFGLLVAALAPVVTAGPPASLVTYAGCVIALAVRARQDEQRLHEQVGTEYEAYCRDVSRLIPFVW